MFVGTRVAEIQELTDTKSWPYGRTDTDPPLPEVRKFTTFGDRLGAVARTLHGVAGGRDVLSAEDYRDAELIIL